ncbi:MAG: hypothetical protein ABIO37_00805 [Caulobacteraceae bacterium]
MSNVFPFIAKLAADGDWSGSERAWLMELAGRVSPVADGMEVVFGHSDEGDPWCVVLDPAGEVLVHVARVAGQFILHHLPDDGVQQGADLATALRRFMGADWNDGRDDVVVQLNTNGRQAQTILALIVATAFYYATADASDLHAGGQISALPLETSVAAAVLVEDTGLPDSHRDAPTEMHRAPEAKAEIQAAPSIQHVGTEVAVAAPPSTPHPVEGGPPEPPRAPPSLQIGDAPKAAPLWLPAAFERVVGGDGNDLLIGGPGPSLLFGGAGDDTLDGGGAPPGKADVLEGGPGNDRILLSASAVAIGGPGADTFVVGSETPHTPPAEAATAAPALTSATTPTPAPTPPPASTPLGVILDFHQSEGDQLVSASGGKVVVLNTTLETDVLSLLHQQPGLQNFTATPGERVEVDVDGDGKMDGYLLIAPENAVTVTAGTVTPGHEPAPEAAGGAPVVGVSAMASAELF